MRKEINKKGQGAMEFLMTYGWAFLVIIIMIGALSYLGMFDTNNLLNVNVRAESYCEKGIVGQEIELINYDARIDIIRCKHQEPKLFEDVPNIGEFYPSDESKVIIEHSNYQRLFDATLKIAKLEKQLETCNNSPPQIIGIE